MNQQRKKSWSTENKKLGKKFFCAFLVCCKIVTFPSGTTTFSSSFSETSLKSFHVMNMTNYWAQNVLWMITNERNTIVKRFFLRKLSSVVTARFPSRNLATYCAISGANTSQAVVIVVFLVPRTLESWNHWLIIRSSITTIYLLPLRMLISPIC